jgi:predicted transposase/invertase (TIGR01784 family)
MLPLTDLRHTRVYQEAKQEGRQEGREKEREAVARRLLKQKKPLTEIAETSGLTVAQIRKLQKKRPRD